MSAELICCDKVITAVKDSGLNYKLTETPFQVEISVKKRFVTLNQVSQSDKIALPILSPQLTSPPPSWPPCGSATTAAAGTTRVNISSLTACRTCKTEQELTKNEAQVTEAKVLELQEQLRLSEIEKDKLKKDAKAQKVEEIKETKNLKEECLNLQNRLKLAEDQSKTLSGKLKTKEKEIDGLKAKSKQLEENNRESEEVKENLKKEIATLKAKKETEIINKELTLQKKINKDQKKEGEKNLQKLKEFQSNISNLENQLDKANSLVEELKKREQESKGWKDKTVELEARNLDNEKEKDNLIAKINDNMKECESLRRQLKKERDNGEKNLKKLAEAQVNTCEVPNQLEKADDNLERQAKVIVEKSSETRQEDPVKCDKTGADYDTLNEKNNDPKNLFTEEFSKLLCQISAANDAATWGKGKK